MAPAELASWREFYIQFPFDDLHRYHRPAALISASFGEGEMMPRIQSRLRWLAPEREPEVIPDSDMFSAADLRTMAAFGVVPPKGSQE